MIAISISQAMGLTNGPNSTFRNIVLFIDCGNSNYSDHSIIRKELRVMLWRRL